ncbi:MAG: sensor histidine kinase [Acidobacteriota bacterium]|nr:sensor histidine kinase [Acidobacteriota bacterium]
MLHEFIVEQRPVIIERTRLRVKNRTWPSVSADELEFGVPLFLTQLAETLRLEATAEPFPEGEIQSDGERHGAEMMSRGYSIAQVVQDYGDICQVVTELAVESHLPITAEEFQTLNHCLDVGIAGAVTAHARITRQVYQAEELERLGHTAHEARDFLSTAFLSFHSLKRGDVAINGSTGAMLGRSLMGLRDLIDRTLSEVRLVANVRRIVRLPVAPFLDEIAATGLMHAEYRNIKFTVEPIAEDLTVDADPQLLGSAIMNVLHNGFKNTPKGGNVTLRAFASKDNLCLEVADQCGGIPAEKGDLFKTFGDRRGRDRSGLGMGLSIARKAIRAHGGDINVENKPGHGCVFSICVPLATTTNTPATLFQASV